MRTLIINSQGMGSRDPFDEVQILVTKEADVSFRTGLLHHVLFLDKIPGKKPQTQKLLERFYKDILETGQ